MTHRLHGAGAVPVNASPAAAWISTGGVARDAWLPSTPHEPVVPPTPRDVRDAAQLAAGPLRRGTIVPIVGVEGGAGRTTVTRLLGRACTLVRDGTVAAVDAAPLWGGLTAAVTLPGDCPITVQDFADLPWPPRPPVSRLLDCFASDSGVPTLRGPSSIEGDWSSAAVIDDAIRRTAAIVDLTLVDTTADPTSLPIRSAVWPATAAPVWVCTATRAGLWGLAEAIGHFERLGAKNLAARSVVAAVAHRRRWPADAAAAETQLTGCGFEIIRLPFARRPLTAVRCAHAAVRLLAAIVARSGA